MSQKHIPAKNKLASLRKWLSLEEAARCLTILLDEEVHELQVLRLALDGKLQLSVNFINPVTGQRGKIYSSIDEKNFPPHLIPLVPALLGRFPLEGKILDLDTDLVEFDGVWDLLMVDGQKHFIEAIYQNAVGGPEVIYPECEDAWFVREGGEVCRLFEKVKGDTLDSEENMADCEVEGFYYSPAEAGCLPDDSELVVQPKALFDLQDYFVQNEVSGKEENGIRHINASFLDTEHIFYANELKVAVEAWTELYEKNPPQHVPPGGHKTYITKWLEKNYPQLGQRAKNRISTVINPNPKGGASPTE